MDAASLMGGGDRSGIPAVRIWDRERSDLARDRVGLDTRLQAMPVARSGLVRSTELDLGTAVVRGGGDNGGRPHGEPPAVMVGRIETAAPQSSGAALEEHQRLRANGGGEGSGRWQRLRASSHCSRG